ncbi:MAG: uroporphyrinogen-III C-methyltransferase, partial [Thermodesulfobacteriota bacterium]
MDSIVYLIGAGPGDPGLITVKGKNVLKTADVIVYDSLINKKLLNYCKKSAKLIFVGKTAGRKETTQNEINKKLVYYSKRNKTVARLKGGDPFIFGRGGEEAEALVKAGITIEFVPGVSSISSVPGYSGVPLTHRKYNSSFTVITGHENPFKSNTKLNWKSISGQDTLVFLMSLKNIDLIMKKLADERMPKKTPVLVTSWGTVPRQKSVIGNVGNISKLIRSEPVIKSPAIIL